MSRKPIMKIAADSKLTNKQERYITSNTRYFTCSPVAFFSLKQFFNSFEQRNSQLPPTLTFTHYFRKELYSLFA
jgi:hypothetical protein